MKVDGQTLSATGPARHRSAPADTESKNAFGQLLRSLERDVWTGASQPVRPGREAGMRAAHSREPAATRLQPTGMADRTSNERPDIADGRHPVSDRCRIPSVVPETPAPALDSSARARRDASPAVLAGSLDTLLPVPERRGAPGSRPACGDSGPESGLPSIARSASSRPATAAEPFSVVVANGDGGVTIALRVRLPRDDDLEALALHAWQALRRYGIGSATLLVNGIDRNLTIPGEQTHGD
ncbi:hypothetical protein [Burkholderia sp. BCC1977]|uniref:hypothetical protein n=1 Tax=Burkholderia sp. BCC1977 TaxID=2817440 RepID=UPI002ABDAAAC|nr:hypothetical protein [Burkholderia sp. BCC1977]